LTIPQFSDSPIRSDVLDFSNYTRPNYSDILSPIQSDQYSLEIYEKERKARKRMRRLINEQTEINEALADENDLLTRQQESLLQLLSNKDRQLQSLAASLNSSSISSLKQKISGSSKGSQTYRLDCLKNLFLSRVKRSWKKLGTYTKVAGLKDAELKSAVELSRCAVLSIVSILKGRVQAQAAGMFYRLFKKKHSKATFSSLHRIIGKAKARALHSYRHKVSSLQLKNTAKHAQLRVCLQSYQRSKLEIMKGGLIKWHSFKLLEKKISSFIQYLQRPTRSCMLKWAGTVRKMKLNSIQLERGEALKKVTDFSEKFLKLSSLKWNLKSASTKQAASALKAWGKEAKRIKDQNQGARILYRVLKVAMKPSLAALMHKPHNMLVCYVLKRILKRRLQLEAFRRIEEFSDEGAQVSYMMNETKLNEQLKNYQDSLRKLTIQTEDLKDEISAAKIRLSKLDNLPNSPVSRLSQELNEKRQECAVLAGKIESHIAELEIYKSKNQQEREELDDDCRSLKEAFSELKSKLNQIEAEQNQLLKQLASAEDERKLNKIQLTHVQSSVKKLHQQYESTLKEQDQNAASESESRKQLIKLTTQIDTLATDKENILGNAESLSGELSKLKDRLMHTIDEGRKLSEGAFEAQAKEEELTSKITDTTARGEAEVNKQTLALNANFDHISKLEDEAMQLREVAQKMRHELSLKSSSTRSAQKKEMKQKNEEMRRYLSELEKHANTGRSTNSQLNIKVLNLNKEMAELKTELAGAKGAYSRALTTNKENRAILEQLKAEQASLIREKDKALAEKRDREAKDLMKMQSLENTRAQLESKMTRLSELIRQTSSPASPISKQDQQRLQYQLKQVEAELEECRQEASNSREEVTRILSEIENYARILEVMEDKLAEAETRTRTAEKRRAEAVSQMEEVRQRYIAILASSKGVSLV